LGKTSAFSEFKAALKRSHLRWAYGSALQLGGVSLIFWSLLSIGGGSLSAILLKLGASVLDTVQAGIHTRQGFEQILGPIILIGFCMYGSSLFYILPNLVGQVMQNRFYKGSTYMVVKKLKGIPLRWFDDPDFVSKVERLNGPVNLSWLASSTVNFFGSLSALVSLFILALSASWPLFLLVVGLSLVYFLNALKIALRRFQHWDQERDAEKRINYYKTSLTASWYAKDIRVLSASPRLLQLWKTEACAAWERQKKTSIDVANTAKFRDIFGLISQFAIMGAAVYFLWTGAFSLGTLLLFTNLAFGLAGNLTNFSYKLIDPLYCLKALIRFKEFFDKAWDPQGPISLDLSSEAAEKEIEKLSKAGADTSAGQIKTGDRTKIPEPSADAVFELQNVSYRYTKDAYALKNINLCIKRGEIVALLGHNGAGKSTLTKLLLGFYVPSEGHMFFEGKPYGPEIQEELSRKIGASFQEFRRFELTLRENLAFGDLSCLDKDDVLKEALLTGGGESILHKACGDLGRYVGRWYTDDGLELSGGEFQRLTTSRAFVNKRSIFVMDEPASMLDPLAEIKQFEALRSNLGQRTAVLVSHRIGFARLADRILVLDKGSLAEMGSHESLMAQKGLYWNLFTTQASWYEKE